MRHFGFGKRDLNIASAALVAFVGVGLNFVLSARVAAERPVTKQIEHAIRTAIPQLEQGATGSANQRKCFTCHHQALPLITLAHAEQQGFRIDGENFARQVQHTINHLKRGRNQYRSGRGQGGKIFTAGYAMWALDAADYHADETTDAVVDFLLQHQVDSDHWSQASRRPPTSGSDFAASYLALRALAIFAGPQRAHRIEQREREVASWLAAQEPIDTEDKVFRIRLLAHIDAEKQLLDKATAELVDAQRDDRGWSQIQDRESDAYATATVLAALQQAAGLTGDHPAVQRGLAYLLDTQLADGTWHVATRADGFQPYFESGFPHGKDQFISMSASCWSTLALLHALPHR